MRFPSWLGLELIEVSQREKWIATCGGGLSILALIVISTWALPVPDAVVVVTSMGASAVLLFGVPHGPLSQPWPVMAGHLFSAMIGVTCARLIPAPLIAAACAVGVSIGVMMQFKCIHPPGGATALAAVMGGPAIRDLGYWYVLCPVAANACLMVLMSVLMNFPFAWRRYPASLSHPPEIPHTHLKTATHDEILAAIRSLDSFVDIDEEDLMYLVERLSSQQPKL